MFSENVEVVRKGIEAINARDLDSLADLVAPGVVWDDTEGFAGLRSVHSGQAALRRWLEAVLEPWVNLRLVIEEVRDGTDDRVYLDTTMRGRGRASGAQTDVRVWMVFWLTGGKIAKRRLFWDRNVALEAAGLGAEPPSPAATAATRPRPSSPPRRARRPEAGPPGRRRPASR